MSIGAKTGAPYTSLVNQELGAQIIALANIAGEVSKMSLEHWSWASICFAPFAALAGALTVMAIARHKHSNRSAIYASVTFLIVLLAMPLSLRIVKALVVKTDQASAAAHVTLNQLPQIDDIELAAVQDTSFFSEEGGCCCSYGRLWILYGTSIPEPVAFEAFIQQLHISGWIKEGTEYENSRGFICGGHAYLNVSYGGNPAGLWRNLGQYSTYLTVTTNYSYSLSARIDYILPSREQCWR